MQCPVCDERLRVIEKYGVEVDICPSCKGVWLDRGELDKIIEMSERGGPEEHHRSDDRDHDHDSKDRRDDEHRHNDDRNRGEYEHGRKKKSSFLGEILGGFGGED